MKDRKPIKGRFKDKVAIVTGGSSGIGRPTVEELCKEGARVAFTGISNIGVATARQMAEGGHDVLFCRGDMAIERFCRGVVEQVVAKWGRVNYLVNNAFSFTAKGLDSCQQDWDRVLQAGPVAYAVMVQAVVPSMKEQGGGSIVNMSSISAFIAQPNRWTYNAAKGAVHTLTKCMALDLAPYGIRVNQLLDLYRARLRAIEDIVRRERVVTLPAREALIRLATEAEVGGDAGASPRHAAPHRQHG